MWTSETNISHTGPLPSVVSMTMNSRAIRRVFWGVLGGVLLGCGALIAVLMQGDALEKAVLGQISNSLLTRGHITEIDLNVWDDFPMVSLSLGEVWVAGSGVGGPGAGAYSGDTLLRADRIGLTLNAWSLLGERPEVRALTVEGAELVLAEREDGAWNTAVWRAGTDSAGVAFAVDALRLRDVRVQVGETPLVFEEADCSVAFDAAGLDAAIRAKVEVHGVPLEVGTRLEQRGDAWAFSDLKARAWGAEAEGKLRVEGGQVALDLAYEGLRIDRVQNAGLLPSATTWHTRSALRGNLTWDGTTWKGHAKATEATVDLPQGLAPWVETAPAIPLEITCTATAFFRYDPNGLRVDVPSVQAVSPGLETRGELTVTPQATQWKGTVQLSPLSLLALPPIADLEWTAGEASATVTVDVRPTDVAVSGSFQLTEVAGTYADLRFQGSARGNFYPNRLELLAAEVAVDDWQMEAAGSMQQPFTSDAIRADLSVHIPRMVLHDEGSAGSWWEELELPPGSEVHVRAEVDTLQWGANRWKATVAKVALYPQRAVATGRTSAYGGAVVWEAEATWSEAGARAEVQHVATSVDVRQLFIEMADFGQTTLRAEHVTGLLDSRGSAHLHWNADGTFNTNALRWQGDQTLREGTLQNVEALEYIPDYLSGHRMIAPLINPSDLREKMRSIVLQPVSTPIYFLHNSFHIPYLILESENLHVSLEGAQSLAGDIDYSVGIAIREFTSVSHDDIGVIEDDGLGNYLFINLLGTVDEVEFKWDRTAQREHRRKNLQAERDRLKSLWQHERGAMEK